MTTVFQEIQEARKQGRLEVLKVFGLTERDYEERIRQLNKPRAVPKSEQMSFDFKTNGSKIQQ